MKLLDYILKSRQTYSQLFRDLFIAAEQLNGRLESAGISLCGVFYRQPAQLKQLFCGGIALRVNARVVENVFALGTSDESGALLLGLCAELRHFLELGA